MLIGQRKKQLLQKQHLHRLLPRRPRIQTPLRRNPTAPTRLNLVLPPREPQCQTQTQTKDWNRQQ